MTYTIDRFEDGELAVLESEAGESLNVPLAELPAGAQPGDVLHKLPWYRRTDAVCYAPMPELTAKRKQDVQDVRASLPRYEGEGDIEL
jgi:hypothetical protein